ncbi:MAG: CPBP family intramembrane metalloprotease [Prevotellaceae bacterium]|jgi:membrane protease YdiL (CAAX protease family)|nr:CPBP family intramembrane metalloprotease [Prevotellaceae bacterium]
MSNINTSAIPPYENKPLLNGWVRAVLIIIPWFIFMGFFQLLGTFISGTNPLDKAGNYTSVQITVIQLFSLIGTLTIVYIFRAFLDKNSLMNMGFRLKGYWNNLFLGYIIGAILIIIGFYILLGLNEIEIANTNFNLYSFCLSILFFMLVSFNEEIIMRGYILNNLMQSMNKYIALLISSSFFSIAHIFNPNFGLIPFLNITLAGIILGLPYIFTKNLWFSIALHFSWNFFQGHVFGFSVSGETLNSITIQTQVEDNLLNGGEFGLEGSWLSSILLTIAIILLWWWLKKRKQQSP